jgi:hypothetical protein
MGMDEVSECMKRFESELGTFQKSLQDSISDVRRHHEAVSLLWQDTMRREYDLTWVPLEEAMETYLRKIGPQQVETMRVKLQHLSRYLHGN